MADITIQALPLTARALSSPVAYELSFVLANTIAKTNQGPVDVYIIEDSYAELICPCPIPALEILETIYPFSEVLAQIYPSVDISAAFASGECEDC